MFTYRGRPWEGSVDPRRHGTLMRRTLRTPHPQMPELTALKRQISSNSDLTYVFMNEVSLGTTRQVRPLPVARVRRGQDGPGSFRRRWTETLQQICT